MPLPFDLANPCLGIYSKLHWEIYEKTYVPVFILALFTMVEDW